MAALTEVILRLMDWLLGWMLSLPLDAALAIVALGTSAILTFIRPFTTDQDLLRRCKEDKSRLARLMKQAKRERDKAALARYRATQAAIAMKQMKAEFKPLLVVIVPVAMLAVWCFARLGFVPAKPGEAVAVNAYFPASAIGDVAHVVPQEGLRPDDGSGWIQRIVADPRQGASGKANGIATWKIRATGRAEPYTLEIRFGGRTWTQSFLVDGRRYLPPVGLLAGAPADGPHGREAALAPYAIETALKPYKPFGLVPGIPRLGFDPWLVGYLVMTIPFVFLLRHLCRIN